MSHRRREDAACTLPRAGSRAVVVWARRPFTRAAACALVSLGGVGFLPRGAATAGAAAGALVLKAIRPSTVEHAGLMGGAVGVGHVLSGVVATPDDPDPRYFVLDEVAGLWLALLGFPPTWWNCVLGVVVFRAFDKVKPGPVRLVEKRAGRWAVMGDDLAAGALANILLRTGRAALARLG